MNEAEFANSYQVVMPRLGLTMRDGKILEWLKQEGEYVSKGEPLFTIENEKASLEIESPASGSLHILVPVNVTVPILAPVGVLTGSAIKSGHHSLDQQVESKPDKTLADKAPQVRDSQKEKTSRIIASPKARAIAKQAGFDLTNVKGSGIRNMVVAADLLRLREKPPVRVTPLARRKAAEQGIDLNEITGSGPRGMVRCRDLDGQPEEKTCCDEFTSPVPLGELRSIIAARLGQSWVERPQVTLNTEADATQFLQARKQLNAELASRQIKLSINALIIKLVAKALLEHPYMNVSLIPEGLCQHRNVNIGLAVDTEPGLMVPVVHDADKLSHIRIQQVLDEVISRTMKGRLTARDISEGTFTVTNLGAYDIDAFTPIINPPECAILGVGRIYEKPVGVNGVLALRDMVTLSLSFDHRLVDGAPAARFLQRIKHYIEQPFLWALWRNDEQA